MANIRKSFNFRSGLQVDTSNFIVNENGNVGVGTTTPQVYKLNVYGDNGLRVVGLTTTTNLYAGIGTVGILTATSARVSAGLTVGELTVGNMTQPITNVIGFGYTAWVNDDPNTVGLRTDGFVGIGTTTLSKYSLLIGSDPEVENAVGIAFTDGNINATGIVTANKIYVGAAITFNDTAGVVEATTFDGSLDVSNLSGSTIALDRIPQLTNVKLPDNINKTSGIATFSKVEATDFVGIASTAKDLTSTAEISITNVSAGIVTGTTRLRAGDGENSGSIGINTDDTTYALHAFRTGSSNDSILKVTSENAQSIIAIGRSETIDQVSDVGLLKYGNTSGAYTNSNEKSFDILNQADGPINFYIDGETTDSKVSWIRGNSTTLMTLTKDGTLGINQTNLTDSAVKLHVEGISTHTGTAYFDNGITITSGSFDLSALNITLASEGITAASFKGDVVSSDGTVLLDTGADANGSDGLLSINVNTSSGISTFSTGYFSTGIGIATEIDSDEDSVVSINTEIESRVTVSDDGRVGLGTTNPRSILDLSDAGGSSSALRYVIPPVVTTTERTTFTAGSLTVPDGAIIFNSTNSRLEVYVGGTWYGIATET